MRTRIVAPPPRPHVSHRRSLLWGISLVMLLLSLLSTGLLVGPAHALSLGKKPKDPTKLQQALKKKIHVTHTGKPAPPDESPAQLNPLRPLSLSLPAYNSVGINDSTTSTANTGFDGVYRSYQPQALQDVGLVPGITITSQNITYIWPSVSPGQADNYAANGQVIPVQATAGALNVGFLGASENGSYQDTVTLTYTDTTTSTATLGLTDWWNGTAQYIYNQQVVHMTTITSKHGTQTGNFYLYSATVGLNTSKTLQSVTLPSSSHMHIFAVGVSGPAFGNVGITDDSNTGLGGYDTPNGSSYSSQALASVFLTPGQPFDCDGIQYIWPQVASGTNENYQAAGQILPIIPVPNATVLGFLGSSTGGNASGTATMTFTDSTTQTFPLSLTNWQTSTPVSGNTQVASMSYLNQHSGRSNTSVYVFNAEVAIPAGKTLQSVTLPSTITGGQLHVFAIGTRSLMNSLGTSNTNQPGAGNLDSFNHTSYSIQALEALRIKQGQTFNFNGVSFPWPASYGQLADNYQAAGQVIPVTPVANATTLAFLGAATNGPSTGSGTITYTDSTTSPLPLNLTDWWNCTPSNGNLVAAQFTTLNIPGGSRSGTYCLYYTEVSLQAGKTLQSITLPSSVTQGQLHIFAIGTHSQFNNTGISDNSNPTGANFDGNGASYSAQDFADPTIAGWNPGDTLTYEGINYIWPGVPAGAADNYQAAGQIIPITPVANATTLGFVGAGAGLPNGVSGQATLKYTDNSTQYATLAFADWRLPTGVPPLTDRLFALLPDYNDAQGTHSGSAYLFETEIALTPGKTLQSVQLPAAISGGSSHVFMMATRSGENYPNNIGTSDDSDTNFANLDTAGRSYSVEALESQGITEGQPFTFNNIPFTWPASYSVIPDNYQAAGQIIPLTSNPGDTTLAFLGTGTNTGGALSSGTATITYTDTSTQPITLAFNDWWTSSPLPGNQVVATLPYINTSNGQQTQAVKLYYTDTTLQAGKTVASVTLPSTVSAGQLHVFAISTGTPATNANLLGDWKFDDGSGTTASDSSGQGHTGSFSGTPTWTTGITNGAISLNGSTDWVNTSTSILNTSGSFTVTAWVKLNDMTTYRTAVSQDGTNVSGFYLQYTGPNAGADSNQFALTLQESDSTSAYTTRIDSSITPTSNTWYHLVAVHDASTNLYKLYVNGVLTGTQTMTTPWNATGETVIGRGEWAGMADDLWSGSIDEVRVYSRVLSDQEILNLYNAR